MDIWSRFVTIKQVPKAEAEGLAQLLRPLGFDIRKEEPGKDAQDLMIVKPNMIVLDEPDARLDRILQQFNYSPALHRSSTNYGPGREFYYQLPIQFSSFEALMHKQDVLMEHDKPPSRGKFIYGWLRRNGPASPKVIKEQTGLEFRPDMKYIGWVGGKFKATRRQGPGGLRICYAARTPSEAREGRERAIELYRSQLGVEELPDLEIQDIAIKPPMEIAADGGSERYKQSSLPGQATLDHYFGRRKL